MKKILIISVILTTALLLSSCKDWLDMPSETKADSESIFLDINRAEMAVLAAYQNTFHQEMPYQHAMGTDELVSTEGTNNSKNQIGNYVYDPSINIPMSTYTNMYSAIEYVNVCIDGIPGMSVSESEQTKRDMLLGEAYAIRAMAYFHLVRIWGDVPYMDRPVAVSGEFYYSRTSRDTIYDRCVEDLKRAVELLPWKSEYAQPTERFSKNAAYGMLARVALYAAGYSLRWDLNSYSAGSLQIARRSDAARVDELYRIARDAANAVIVKGENDLLTNYDQVFRNLTVKAYNAESMLEYGSYGPNSLDHRHGYANGMFTITGSVFGKSQPAMASIATYWFDFDENDTRRDVTICNHAVNTTAGEAHLAPYVSRTIGKYRSTWKNERGTSDSRRDINYPVLRFSDVLLMYAEAENYLNGPANATAAFERVRTRAFGGNSALIGTTPTTKDAFQEAIIAERRLELGFEGLRKSDLMRWGILYEKLTEEKAKLVRLVNRTGEYTNVPTHIAYKPEVLTLESSVIGLPFHQTWTSEPTDAEVQALNAQGYIVRPMFASSTESKDQFNNINDFSETAEVVTSLFRGLVKNKVEILPFSTSTIDNNIALIGQQQPAYSASSN